MNEAIGTGVLGTPEPEELHNAPNSQCNTNATHHDVLIDDDEGIDEETDEVSA